MQLRRTELLRRRVGVIHRSWNKRRSLTPAPSDGLQQAGRQTCNGDIMNGSHKTSPGVSEPHAFCFCDFFFFSSSPRSAEGGGEGWGPWAELIGVTRARARIPAHFPHCLQHSVLLSSHTGLCGKRHQKMCATEHSQGTRSSREASRETQNKIL